MENTLQGLVFIYYGWELICKDMALYKLTVNTVCSEVPYVEILRNSVRLAIRKLTYAPEEPAPQPSAEATKDFMMSPGNLRLEASLDKEVNLPHTFRPLIM